MIVLDTHIWIWWVDGNANLTDAYREWIAAEESSGIVVPAISCWEVAKLVENGRLAFSIAVEDWLRGAVSYPGVSLYPLTQEVAIASTRLPPPFHKDPADQMIVATARLLNCPLVTMDSKILAYPHVVTTRSA